MNEDGISLNSNMMQSMSSFGGGLGQPGHANLSAQMSQNNINSYMLLQNSNQVVKRGTGHGPSSTTSNTADSSINKMAIGSSNSVMSLAGYDSQTSAIFQKQRNLMMSSK